MEIPNIEDLMKLAEESNERSQQDQNMDQSMIPPHLEGLDLPHIETLFPKTVAIYKFDSADHLELKNFILDYISTNKDECRTNYNGSNTTSWFNDSAENLFTLDEPILNKFKSFLSTSYETLVKIYQWKMKPEEHTISECWINRSTKGGFQNKHSHSNAWVSGTYYLKFDPGASPIRFSNNSSEFSMPYLFSEVEEPNIFNSQYLDLYPKEGHLMLWPSNYLHETLPDLTDERISISMNFLPSEISAGAYSVKLSK
tara:strand:+ start:149 stop:916 length:768 start_codon:yes stop_codon:yes gene_type:complete